VNGRPYDVLTRARPLRVAFLVHIESFPPESDRFQTLIDQIVDWCNTSWGGRTNHVCFFSGSTLSDAEWEQLEIADPDYLLAFAQLPTELILQLSDRIGPCYINVKDISRAELNDIRVSITDRIGVPPTPQNLRRLDDRVLFIKKPRELLLFEFAEGCDPDIRRFIHRNFGTYHQWIDPNNGQIRRIAWLEHLMQHIPTHSFRIADAPSLASALTEISGRIRRGGSRPGLPHIAPYQLASLYLQAWPNEELRDRFQVIVGDSLDDFSEHWNGMRRKRNWSDTHRHQLWIPTKLISDSGIRESLHDWVCGLANVGSGHRVEVLSRSLSEEDVADLRNYLRKHELPVGTTFVPSPTILQRQKQSDMETQSNTAFIPWTSNDDVRRDTGFSSNEVLALEKADPLDAENPDGSWMVDLQIEQISRVRQAFVNKSWWYLPRQNSGGALRTLFRQPARMTRSHRFSVHVQNREGGIAARLKPELKLRLLSDDELIGLFITEPQLSHFYTSDARNTAGPRRSAVWTCKTSRKGAYLVGLIDLFGDFWTAKAFCERRFWRQLFNGLASHRGGAAEELRQKLIDLLNKRGSANVPNATDVSDEILRCVRGQLRPAFATFRDCVRERSKLAKEGLPEVLIYTEGRTIVQHHGAQPVTHDEMKEGLDTLLALDVLRLGIERICPRCNVPSWFHIDSITQHVTCPGCGTTDALSATEPWSYGLNSLVQMGVLQGALAVLHALTVLAARARTFFTFSPSLDLFRQNSTEVWHELDVACVVDGEFVFAEVKDGPVTKKAFDDLEEIAGAIRPQRAVVFLPLNNAIEQKSDLQKWSEESQARIRSIGTTVEVYTLPGY